MKHPKIKTGAGVTAKRAAKRDERQTRRETRIKQEIKWSNEGKKSSWEQKQWQSSNIGMKSEIERKKFVKSYWKQWITKFDGFRTVKCMQIFETFVNAKQKWLNVNLNDHNAAK